MKQLIYVSCWFLGVGGVLAQPEIEWQKSYGGSINDEARSIQQTSDGGYIMTGPAVSDDGDIINTHGYSEFWVLKLDTLGDIIWNRAYGGSSHDIPFDIEITSDGGYIVAGYTNSNDGEVTGNHGDKDVWVLKIDQMGNIQWQKALGGSGWEEAWSIEQTLDGGYIVAGRTSSIDGDVTGFHGYLDYWVLRLDGQGTLLWQRSLGGSDLDIGYAVEPTTDGGFIITGEAESTDGDVTDNHGNADFWVVKLNFEGKIEWKKALGGTGADRGNDIHQVRDGGYIAIGQTTSQNGDVSPTHGGQDFWIVKLTSEGDLEWQKTLGGSSDDFGRYITQTEDDGYVAIGTTSSINGDVIENKGLRDIWIIKLSTSGDVQWQKVLGGSLNDFGSCIKQTSDRGFVAAGFNWSTDGDASSCKGKNDFWIIKLSPASTPTSTPSTQTQPLTLSPNPAQNTLTIQTQEPGKTDIQIYNLLGQVLQHQSLEMSDLGATQVDISQLPRGLYLITATGASGQMYSGRFLKGE